MAGGAALEALTSAREHSSFLAEVHVSGASTDRINAAALLSFTNKVLQGRHAVGRLLRRVDRPVHDRLYQELCFAERPKGC